MTKGPISAVQTVTAYSLSSLIRHQMGLKSTPEVLNNVKSIKDLKGRLRILPLPVIISSVSDPFRPLGMESTALPCEVYYINTVPFLGFGFILLNVVYYFWSNYRLEKLPDTKEGHFETLGKLRLIKKSEISEVGQIAVKDFNKRQEEKNTKYALSNDFCIFPESDPDKSKLIENLKWFITHGHQMMIILIGPEGIGKSVTLDALPKMVGIDNVVHVDIRPRGGGYRVIDEVYKHFKDIAVANGYPSSSVDLKEGYLRKVFESLGGKNAAICLDFKSPPEDAWAFSHQVRDIYELGVNVFATTNVREDIILAKEEDRRTVMTFPETPMHLAVAYVRRKYGKSGKDILPPEDYVTDDDLREYLEAIPRSYARLDNIDRIIYYDLPKMYKEGTVPKEVFRKEWNSAREEFRKSRFIDAEMEVRGVMSDAKCKKRRNGDFELAIALGKKSHVGCLEIIDMCSGENGVSALEILLSNNILRNVPTSNTGDFDNLDFKYRYEYMERAMSGMKSTLN